MRSVKMDQTFRMLMACTLLSACSTASSESVSGGKLPTGPDAGDMDLSPFYRWTDALPAELGGLLREEPIAKQEEMGSAAEAHRILYTSTDVRWHSGPVPVSGTLYLPNGPPPAGGWPLVAWGHGTLGIADVCAPSWTGFKSRDASYMNRWLQAGFAVVATDYQGLGGPGPHPYLDWRVAGRSVLDSVRAALALKSGLISNQVLITGQSQGASSALGAVRLSREYAPELNILGMVATGLNSTFSNGPISLPARDSTNMFLSFASGGVRDNGPKIEDVVSSKGKQLLDKSRQACTKEIGMLARELKVGSLAETLAIPMDQFASMRLPVTDMPMEKIDVPLMIATGLADDTVTPILQYAAASALCASGNSVTWLTYPGMDHDDAMHGSFEDSVTFARTLLAGEKVSPNCSQISEPGPPEDIESDSASDDE
ncbi:lipase family protein [Parasphingorhabdus sp.]|uniref:lipase family protein n=1 Tax=Parasphingorhabdus sp. TaxID=2709688 RepID=UPI002B26EE6F|nr:lipase family protein [Parasphingorhabdus sp.]